MIGTELKRTYRVVEPLGQGGMGTLYVAEHATLPRRFAVKFLTRVEQATPELLARFEREAQIASGLAHPNIVEVIDFDHLEDGTPFIVMELLEGEDLATRLARVRTFAPETLAPVARQICAGLAAAHGAGVVHRDLKPQNIFLQRWGGGEVVKILDFGISKLTRTGTGLTADQAVMGTAHYMAPEQTRGAATADARADLFSLGAILYECLTGTLAFPGANFPEVVHALCYGPRPALKQARPALPAALDACLGRLLQVEPDERYPDVQAAWDALAPPLGAKPSPLTQTVPPGGEPAAAATGAGDDVEQAATVASTPDGDAGEAATVASTPDGDAGEAATVASTPDGDASRAATVPRSADGDTAPSTPARRGPPWWPFAFAGAAFLVVVLAGVLTSDRCDRDARRQARKERRATRKARKQVRRSKRKARTKARRAAARPAAKKPQIRVALAPPDCPAARTNFVSLMVESLGQSPGLLVPQDEVDEAWKKSAAGGGTRAGRERKLGRTLGASLVVSARCTAAGLRIAILRIRDGVVVGKARAPLQLDRPSRRRVATIIGLERLKLEIRTETKSEEAARQFVRALTLGRGGYNPANLDASIAAFRAAHRADPTWGRARIRLATALMYRFAAVYDQAALREADTLLTPLWQKEGKLRVPAGMLLAESALKRERIERGKAIVDRLVKLAGDRVGIAFFRSWIFDLLGQDDLAEEVMRAASQKVPHSATLRRQLAAQRYVRGRFALALADMKVPVQKQDRQFRLRGNDPDLVLGPHQLVGAHVQRGLILLAMSRCAEAEQEFQVELSQARERSTYFNRHVKAVAWLGLASARQRLGRGNVGEAQRMAEQELVRLVKSVKNPNGVMEMVLEPYVSAFPHLVLRLVRRYRVPGQLGAGDLGVLEAAVLDHLGQRAQSQRVLTQTLGRAKGYLKKALRVGFDRQVRLAQILTKSRRHPCTSAPKAGAGRSP